MSTHSVTQSGSDLSRYAEQFRRERFTQIPDMIDRSKISLLRSLMSQLVGNAETVAVEHKPKKGEGLTGGSHYLRFDGGHPSADSAIALLQNDLLTGSGLAEVGAALAADLRPAVESVLGAPAVYQRCYFLAYEPGDYISVHNDKQTGNRINVQVPIPVDCRSCLRTLDEQSGLMVIREDIAGSLRFLGPGIWHDVPPFVGGESAMRYVFTLRYRYVEEIKL
ncbi:hypothetical protein ACW9HR_23295 [Nocardia gipuzkoensis]